DALTRVARAKTIGAWLLHERTRTLPLDAFVLFSSIAAVWGTRGLGAYAAANRALDAIAELRRREGRPALSANWGPWDGAGLAAGEPRRDLARAGIRAMSAERALDALERALASGDAHIVAVDVDWSTFLPLMETAGQDLWLRDAATTSRDSVDLAHLGPSAMVRGWMAATGRRREAAIIADLQ